MESRLINSDVKENPKDRILLPALTYSYIVSA